MRLWGTRVLTVVVIGSFGCTPVITEGLDADTFASGGTGSGPSQEGDSNDDGITGAPGPSGESGGGTGGDTGTDDTPEGSTGQAADGTTGGPAADCRLVIAETLIDASGSDDGLEWVKLFNDCDQAADLGGWSLGWGGVDYTYGTVDLVGTVGPGDCVVIGGPTASAGNGSPVFDQAVNLDPDLQNAGAAADGIALFDVPAGQVDAATVPVDALLYGGTNDNGLLDSSGAPGTIIVALPNPDTSIQRTSMAATWASDMVPTPNDCPAL